MTVEFGCPGCGRAVETAPGAAVTCKRCGAEATLPGLEDALSRCLACECPELYRHRDFNQKLGLFLIALGAGLSLWLTTFLPLVIAAAVDLVVYFLIPDVVICYRCKAHHRGFRTLKPLPSFDLERHEHYRFEKARKEGRL